MNDLAHMANKSPDIFRLLIIDDHFLICETLAAALGTNYGMDIEVAGTVGEGILRIEETGRFSAVLLDYDIPEMDGLNGLRRLVKINSGAVALFSGQVNRSIIERAIDAGAGGFIPKTLPLKTLKHAISLIADGELYIPGEFIRRASDGPGDALNLKPREIKVLRLLCEGMQNKEIGRQIGVEETIVKMDVKSICRKLGVRNRTQAVIETMKLGVIC